MIEVGEGRSGPTDHLEPRRHIPSAHSVESCPLVGLLPALLSDLFSPSSLGSSLSLGLSRAMSMCPTLSLSAGLHLHPSAFSQLLCLFYPLSLSPAPAVLGEQFVSFSPGGLIPAPGLCDQQQPPSRLSCTCGSLTLSVSQPSPPGVLTLLQVHKGDEGGFTC